MTLDELANNPGILIATIVLTLAVLVLVDVGSRASWRWWRS
jgi:hypothetical protein